MFLKNLELKNFKDMTEEELKKVKFTFVAHMAMADEHTSTYVSEDGRLGFCDHTLKKNEYEFGRTYRHFRIDDKIYKSYKKFVEALKDFEP